MSLQEITDQWTAKQPLSRDRFARMAGSQCFMNGLCSRNNFMDFRQSNKLFFISNFNITTPPSIVEA